MSKRTTAEASTSNTEVYAGRDEEIEGDYDSVLAEHLKKEF